MSRAVSKKDTQFGADLIEAVKEVVAWKRGEIALLVREVEPVVTPPAGRLARCCCVEKRPRYNSLGRFALGAAHRG
jgi:hypothetical protein